MGLLKRLIAHYLFHFFSFFLHVIVKLQSDFLIKHGKIHFLCILCNWCSEKKKTFFTEFVGLFCFINRSTIFNWNTTRYSGGRLRFYGCKVEIFPSLYQQPLSFSEKAEVLENGQIWNPSIFLNETFRRASSLRFTKNGWLWLQFDACHAHFPKTLIFQKRPPKPTNFEKIFFNSRSNL